MSSASHIKVAIVGAGPAGFYAASHLLASQAPVVQVDMFDRLPTPFGLVRAGVAPDHPKIKSVVRVFERAAAHPGFRFLGGLEFGRDFGRAELLERYHAVVYAVGASSERPLGIPGEDLAGNLPAARFVGWYNGHPDHVGCPVDLSVERAVVVGNGNVALDCARMLMLSGQELRLTDTADYAVQALGASTVRDVIVAGRRGPAQAAFTHPELLELGELEQARVIVDSAEVELDEASQAWLESGAAPSGVRRILETLRGYAASAPSEKPRHITLRFRRSPVEIRGAGRVEEIVLERNTLVCDSTGRTVAAPTGERETVPCGLVIRSIGYLGLPLADVPYDVSRGTVPNLEGRVLRDGAPSVGEYVAGWIRRGPSGVIGTNKKCAQESAEALLEDARQCLLPDPPRSDAPADALIAAGGPAVDWEGWRRIDEHEVARGAGDGRPRVKLTTYDELHAVAGAVA
ncbi:MAG: FAD-dependent oxidoreductase [Solirubrobacteraceae bacterium]